MKQSQMLLLLGALLLAATNSHGVVTSLIVSGTNAPQVNGTYPYDTIVNGKGSWVKGDYVLWWVNRGLGYSWNIEKPSTSTTYYRNWSDPPLPGETKWGCVAPAASPCTAPVVTHRLPCRRILWSAEPWIHFSMVSTPGN